MFYVIQEDASHGSASWLYNYIKKKAKRELLNVSLPCSTLAVTNNIYYILCVLKKN